MARLEYRLLDDKQDFPLLYYYEKINLDEISLRFICEYFVKDGTAYEKTSCAIEDDAYVIYVKKAKTAPITTETSPAPISGNLRLEVRQFNEDMVCFSVLKTYDFTKTQDLLLYLQSDYLYFAEHEWLKKATQVDEDRKLYIYYAQPAD